MKQIRGGIVMKMKKAKLRKRRKQRLDRKKAKEMEHFGILLGLYYSDGLI
jgi:hypothetical protein